MKKSLWTLLAVGCVAVVSATPPAHLVDSLLTAYDAEPDARRRVDILLNLKDLHDSSENELYYSRKLFDEAAAVGDGFAVGASLGSLASHYIAAPDGGDSLETLLVRAEPLLRGSGMEGVATYYRMVEFARKIQFAGTEKTIQLCRDYVDSLSALPRGDVYEEASRLFLKGVAAYKLVSADGNMQMERGLPYWNDELALLERMRPTARRNFHANLVTCLIAAYGSLKDQDALVRVADGYLAMLDDYYRDPEIVRRRPYISKEMSYLVCYYTMCTSTLLDKDKSQAYYERYRRFVDSTAADAGNLLTNKQGFYTISAEYYKRRGEYANALAYTDSLVMLLRPGGVTSQLATICGSRAKLLEHLGRYKEACGVYNEVIGLRDSLSSHKYAEKVGELEVQYGLDKSERDKALLLAEKRQNSLYFALTILVLAIIAVVYLWRNLLRIKRLQHNLSIESQRAQESERLKRDFMGSMSHEIRTPLNAINGFAELIADGGLSAGEHREFAQIIRDNTRMFTSLINDMLEVSQLDNTSAELPKKPIDICEIIRTEIGNLPAKEGVEYRLELDAEEIVFPLHKSYVSILVRELLKNAVKFTEQGSVTVECSREGQGALVISVTDTGCGVPSELAEKVFERFYKGDPFAQGLGLGLSLCRLIVEKSGGTICLDTAYTGGARFVVTLRDA